MIDSLANVKTFCGITGTEEDARIQLIMNGVNEQIISELGYDPEQKNIEEYRVTDGITRTFVLKSAPVSDLVVKFDGETYDADDYVVYSDEGVVVLQTAPSSADKKLLFSYKGGFTEMPDDLKLEFDRLVCEQLQLAKSSGVSSERMGDYQVVYKDGALSSVILSKYVRVLP